VKLPLITPRLFLRSFELQDAFAFSAYRSDPEVARYQGWDAPYSLEQASQFVLKMQNSQPGTPGDWYQLAIELRDSHIMIGDVAFYLLKEDPRQAEIAFTLARSYHGQGFATEAVIRLLEYLFTHYLLHRIRANCDAENTASSRLMERAGMRREGYFIENLWFKGRWSSEYWYAILRNEWQDLRQSQ
jgi:RimJ/RimL family protein N-acetyltransferase